MWSIVVGSGEGDIESQSEGVTQTEGWDLGLSSKNPRNLF